jgi:hypothetical protein
LLRLILGTGAAENLWSIWEIIKSRKRREHIRLEPEILDIAQGMAVRHIYAQHGKTQTTAAIVSENVEFGESNSTL